MDAESLIALRDYNQLTRYPAIDLCCFLRLILRVIRFVGPSGRTGGEGRSKGTDFFIGEIKFLLSV